VLARLSLWLNTLQRSFIITLPVVMLGALLLTFVQMVQWFAPQWESNAVVQLLSLLHQAFYGVMALVIVVVIAFRLANDHQGRQGLPFDPAMVALLAMVTFIAMIHFDHGALAYQHLGVASVAKAMFAGIAVTEVFVWIYRRQGLGFSDLPLFADGQLYKAMVSILPAVAAPIVVVMAYAMINDAVDWVSGWFPWLMGSVSAEQGMTPWQSVTFLLVNQLSWFVGIHGSSFVEVHQATLFNHESWVVFGRQYIDMYANIGGAGCTFGLMLALLMSKRRSHRTLGRYAILPSLFNINELLIFGLPIIFNRFLLVPFLLVPIVTSLLFRLAFHVEWVQWQGGAEIWSTPILLGGYLATGSWQGAALQLVCVVVSFAMYRPFLRAYEKHQEKQQQQRCQGMLNQLMQEADLKEVYHQKTELSRFAHWLMWEWRQAIPLNQVALHYQPKMNAEKKVVGAEALLRWHHPEMGYVSPAIVVALAEINGDIHQLGQWVCDRCFQDSKTLSQFNIRLALNVSPIQLERRSFYSQLEKLANGHGVDPRDIELEITEGQQVQLNDHVLEGIQSLSKMGFTIAVDDFGMGYTSLRYLKSFPVNTLKIDGSIVKDVLKNSVVQDIIASMSSLSHSMGVQLVAEWVETEEQFIKLTELGCDQFQGKRFSMPMTLEQLKSYCAKQGTEKSGQPTLAAE